jgi:hypothetical protein
MSSMRALVAWILVAAWAAPLAAQDAAQQAQAEAERARRELDRAAAEADARSAADRARLAREEAERLAAEARRRVDARQEALAAEYARRRSEREAQLQAQQSETDLARRAAEQRVRIAEDEARRAELERSRADAIRRAQEQQSRIDAQRPPGPYRYGTRQPAKAEPDRLIAMKEGVVLCQPTREAEWRCTGPLRVVVGKLDAGRTIVAAACGAGTIRDLGRARGLRAFGCGFGLNPRSGAPGNRDVPALFGIEVPGRATFRCPLSTDAYCRRR